MSRPLRIKPLPPCPHIAAIHGALTLHEVPVGHRLYEARISVVTDYNDVLISFSVTAPRKYAGPITDALVELGHTNLRSCPLFGEDRISVRGTPDTEIGHADHADIIKIAHINAVTAFSAN